MKPPSGRRLSRLVVVLLVAGASLLASIPRSGDAPALASFAGANGKIGFATNRGAAGDSEIFVANPDGSGPTNLTNNPAEDTAPSWSSDGNKIAFVRDTGGGSEIFGVNADGSSPTNLTNSPAGVINAQPSWSPDGSKIAFSSDRSSGNTDIWTMDANGANPTRLTTDASAENEPAWSPDGARILFSRDGADIWVMNADGTSQTNLTSGIGTVNVEPNWSPNGARIAFASDRAGNLDIWVMDSNGGGLAQLTTDAGIDDQPAWSPEGDSITFTSNRNGGNFDIFTMSANGSAQINLTDAVAGVQDTEPNWQPIVADLAISIADSPDPVSSGQPLTYSIVVRNHGPVVARGVIVTNTLPVNVAASPAAPSQGSCGPPSNQVISCSLGAIAEGATASIAITVVPNAAGTLVDTASVVASAADGDPTDNSASASTTVNPVPLPAPTASVGHCVPRPPVSIRTARSTGDRLDVAVVATAPAGTPDNRLQSIRIVATDNAVVVTPSGERTAPFTIATFDQPLAFSFTARRVSAGPFLVRFVVVDTCGEWPTFVGGGSGF